MDMKIVICEDNAVQCEEIRKLLGRVFFSEADVEIRCFSDGDELVKAVYEKTEFHIDMLFLDINMPRMDGIQTAKLIRKNMKISRLFFWRILPNMYLWDMRFMHMIIF